MRQQDRTGPPASTAKRKPRSTTSCPRAWASTTPEARSRIAAGAKKKPTLHAATITNAQSAPTAAHFTSIRLPRVASRPTIVRAIGTTIQSSSREESSEASRLYRRETTTANAPAAAATLSAARTRATRFAVSTLRQRSDAARKKDPLDEPVRAGGHHGNRPGNHQPPSGGLAPCTQRREGRGDD